MPFSKKITLICLSAVFCFALFCSVTGVTGAFRVNYGEYTAVVKSVSDFENALTSAKGQIIAENPDDYIGKPVYTAIVTLPSSITNKDKLADGILTSNKSLVYSAEVKVNGESKAVMDASVAEKTVLDTLEQFVWSTADTAEFVDDVKVVKGYYPVSMRSDDDCLADKLSALSVKTTSTEITDKEVAFNTVKKLSASVESGKSVVSQKGENGLNRVTEKVTYINGVETGRTAVSSDVIKSPKDKVISVGTKITVKTISQSASQSNSAKRAVGFKYPITKSAIITSYWGDGRGHKGIDFACPYGTSIYAAMSGKVTAVSYAYDWGNYVDIDHGNGYVTRYAHCSSFNVKVGQVVSTGETIAFVGRTGRATGFHLHFEIYKQGTRVNPAPYIGIR